ncbi:MAG: KEOPS complex subunit Cgi121 [Promethearchaeota archaeon]
MIVKEFNIDELNLHFFVGINQIAIDLDEFLNFYTIKNQKEILDQVFKLIEEIQNKFEYSVVQFIKEKFILNSDHIFMACYNLQKAFQQDINISNKKNIELFLYLASNRQIKKSIEAFGINITDFNKNSSTYCIISPNDNIDTINDELIQKLKAYDAQFTLNNQTIKKLITIKEFFKISEDQINIILNSYGTQNIKNKISLKSKYSAVHDLICEKMALLSLEQVKTKKS